MASGQRAPAHFNRPRSALRPPILILDEATSPVDTQVESQIQHALACRGKNRSRTATAHRLSALRQAHRLIVIEQGRIAEQGTHDQLMEKNGVYRRLAEIQQQLSQIKRQTKKAW